MNKKYIRYGIIFLLLALCILFITDVKGWTNILPVVGPSSSSDTLSEEQKKQYDQFNTDNKKALVEDDTVTPGDNPLPAPSAQNIELRSRQENNGFVTVFTKLPGISDGQCTLTVSNGPQTKVYQAEIMYQREASICAGFSVPINELGKGNWSIKLDITSKDNIVSKTINTEVI